MTAVKLTAVLVCLCVDTATSYGPPLFHKPSRLSTPNQPTRQNRLPALVAVVAIPNFSFEAPSMPLPFPSRMPAFQDSPMRRDLDDADLEAEKEAKRVARKHMGTDAMESSKLATALYFQTMHAKEYHQRGVPAHLERSCPVHIEKEYKSFAGKDCIVCKGDVCELADDAVYHAHKTTSMSEKMMGLFSGVLTHPTLSGVLTHPKLSGAQVESMRKREIDQVPPEVSWHESLARTLSVMGIGNRMDFTIHEGSHFLDVVVDRAANPHLQWAGTRGLVVQLLTPNSLRGHNE
eukprot:1779795-Rhodomonas_salina.1